MALLQFLKVPKAGLLLIGALMNIIGTMIKGCDTGNIALNILLGHVIGIREDTGVLSEFPLLHWFIVYAAGYVFGDYDRHLVDKKAFYRYVSPVCGLFSITVVAIEMITGSGMMGGEGANVFYHVNPLDVVVCISISFGLLGLFCALKDLWPAWLMRIVESISRNVNTVYLIQWVLVVWIIQVGLRTITGSAYSDHYFAEILLGICLGIVSVLLAEAWTRWKKKRKKKA